MSGSVLRGLALGACVALPAGVMAADIYYPPAPAPGALCIPVQRTPLLDLPAADLRAEVEQRFAHAVETAERPDIIYSARPAHSWAFETRYACGKAIGYLRTSTVDEYEISRCACFYDRMLRFMP